MSMVSNLPKGCNVETVVPEQLMCLKRQLENQAFMIRASARKAGTRTSTSIRLEDVKKTLVLAVRGEADENWITYTLEELQQLGPDLNPEEEEEEEEEETDTPRSSCSSLSTVQQRDFTPTPPHNLRGSRSEEKGEKDKGASATGAKAQSRDAMPPKPPGFTRR